MTQLNEKEAMMKALSAATEDYRKARDDEDASYATFCKIDRALIQRSPKTKGRTLAAQLEKRSEALATYTQAGKDRSRAEHTLGFIKCAAEAMS